MTEVNKLNNKVEKIVEVEHIHIQGLIKEIIHDSKTKPREVTDVKYHHNRSYSSAPTVIRNGILSLSESTKKGITNFSEQDLQKYDREDHVNGITKISVASTDVDHSKLYRGEMVYCPFHPCSIDILISGEVKAYRDTTNYYNEFLIDKMILPKSFRSVDIRILKIFSDKTIYRDSDSTLVKIQKTIDKYNRLREIALALMESELDIPLREMSEENVTIDLDKMSKAPVLVLK